MKQKKENLESKIKKSTTLSKACLLGIAAALIFSTYQAISSVRKNNNKKEFYASMSYKEVIEYVKTPKQAEEYIQVYLEPNISGAFVKSFKRTHEERKADCADATVAAAALLSDNGYEPTYLLMASKNKNGKMSSEAHAVFIYKEKGKYGTMGINLLDNNDPRFSSLDDVAIFFEYDFYSCGKMEEKVIPDWISTQRNLLISKTELQKHNITQDKMHEVHNPGCPLK
ncbi:MAG: hypothetical protein Q8O89_00440 [Nanoarchaeota archaeon]|nr:hypothetical protein [Nanoarchaeota archaeon]